MILLIISAILFIACVDTDFIYTVNDDDYYYYYDYNSCSAIGCIAPTFGSTGAEGANQIFEPTITTINNNGCTQLMVSCINGSTMSYSNNDGRLQTIQYVHPIILNCSSVSPVYFGFGDYGYAVQTINCFNTTN